MASGQSHQIEAELNKTKGNHLKKDCSSVILRLAYSFDCSLSSRKIVLIKGRATLHKWVIIEIVLVGELSQYKQDNPHKAMRLFKHTHSARGLCYAVLGFVTFWPPCLWQSLWTLQLFPNFIQTGVNSGFVADYLVYIYLYVQCSMLPRLKINQRLCS